MPLRAARVAVAIVAAALAVSGAATAQVRPDRRDVWDLKIGKPAAEQPTDFIEYACGTNGGPPSIRLSGFADFGKCRPDRNGLREVYFRYDDELEYWARAWDMEVEIRRFRGTQVFDFPVVTSGLFDADGNLQGVRVVTDPRNEIRDRKDFWTLANFLRHNFGATDWSCVDLPPAEGETPVGSNFVKRRCTKLYEKLKLRLDNNFYRRPGEVSVNPHTGEPVANAFESSTRFEYYAADFPLASE
ncbi:hypothetical protein NK718_13910 [Alsobacter sp. SYSU M60028]|uniref:Uncharacterized protein n=1 Tax=Alsobacter ponti TaxID=2962936 RepID=A0ABT1LHB1_9HYPH|nr:hypothetical protein [Alsobacter ponti]MCP8939618.1 hypothetical protein [Alsobacter ponti]